MSYESFHSILYSQTIKSLEINWPDQKLNHSVRKSGLQKYKHKINNDGKISGAVSIKTQHGIFQGCCC